MDKLKKDQVVKLLWERALLSYRFRKAQKRIYQTWLESKKKTRKLVCIASRRLGKSTFAFTVCVEEALKHPNANILFVTPVNKNIDRYVSEIARNVLADCPEHLRPTLLPQKSIYVFPNGAQIFCVGSSNQSYENLRGIRVNLAVIDEAQRMEDLEIIVDEVIMPSLMDSNGYLLMFGTVPRQPNNPFMRRYVTDAEKEGSYVEFDIYCAGYPPERLASFRKEVSKEAWEREFECKRNTSRKYNVTPNWSDRYIQRFPQPDYFQHLKGYTGMDIGGSIDQTHIVYAYFDTVLKKLIIRSESVWAAQESRVDRIGQAIKSNEDFIPKKVIRVSDTNNFILMKELAEKHRLPFKPVHKSPGSLEAMLEILNVWIESDRIFVDPSCKVLIHELRYGSWNKTRTDLDRKEGTHCDGILALAYLLSVVNEKGKLPTVQEEITVFIPPPKDPLNLKKKEVRKKEKSSDEAFAYNDDVTSQIWRKEID